MVCPTDCDFYINTDTNAHLLSGCIKLSSKSVRSTDHSVLFAGLGSSIENGLDYSTL